MFIFLVLIYFYNDFVRLRKEQANKKQKTNTDSKTKHESKSRADQLVASNSVEIVEFDQDDANENENFKIMSWNIDGLDKGNIECRTSGIIDIILKYHFSKSHNF
jgi:hypothetical protein